MEKSSSLRLRYFSRKPCAIRHGTAGQARNKIPDEHTIYDSAPDEETAISTEAATSGTIQNSSIRWSLDEKGWLTISGSGEAPVFQSADDQPWAAVRDQITEVWFEDVDKYNPE